MLQEMKGQIVILFLMFVAQSARMTGNYAALLLNGKSSIWKSLQGARPPGYLEKDVHVDVVLGHDFPDVPLHSGHQQKHLLIVDGFGRHYPVNGLP